MADCNWADMKRVLDDLERRGAKPQVFVFPRLMDGLPNDATVPPTEFKWTPRGDTVRVFESEREIPCHYKMELQLDARLPDLPEDVKDEIAAKLQATLDRMIRQAIYGG